MHQNSDIKTFVFLDLETTGLPFEEYNKTKITELCCIAVKSRDIITCKPLPRLRHKINLCFYPQKMISPESEKLTGLSNELLEFEPRFKKDAADLINSFLDILERPVCIVAHNGNYFDYPVLKAEMDKAESQFNDHLLCVDSLDTFKSLYEEDMKKLEWKTYEVTSREETLHVKTSADFVQEGVLSAKKFAADAQATNETTPPKKIKMSQFNENVCVDDLYYKSDSSAFNKSNGTMATPSRIRDAVPRSRRGLDFGTPSFKLADVYRQLSKKEPVASHRAEGDVLVLLECAIILGQRFTNWANNNASKLSDIPMMQPGRKIGT